MHKTSNETWTPDSRDGEKPSNGLYKGKLRRLLAGAALAGSILSLSGDVENSTALFEPQSTLGEGMIIPEFDYTIGDTTLHAVSWKDNTAVNEFHEPIQLTDAMDDIVNSQSIIYDEPSSDGFWEAYDPNYIEDHEKLDQWVKTRMLHPDVVRFAGVDDTDDLSASDLINLTQAVVASNKIYDHDMKNRINKSTGFGVLDYELEKYYERLNIPIDKLVMKEEMVQCETYAALTSAVFDSMKRQYPGVLANTYVKTHDVYDMGHVVNVVATVTARDEVTISVIDTTASDDDPWADVNEYLITDVLLGYGPADIYSPDLVNHMSMTKALLEGDYQLTNDDLNNLIRRGPVGLWPYERFDAHYDDANPDQKLEVLQDYVRFQDWATKHEQQPATDSKNNK